MGITSAAAEELRAKVSRINSATPQKKKYERILNELEKLLGKLDMLDGLAARTGAEYGIMESFPESAMGAINDTYYEKEGRNRTDVMDLISKLAETKDEIAAGKETVREYYEYWAQEEERIYLSELAAVAAIVQGTEQMYGNYNG